MKPAVVSVLALFMLAAGCAGTSAKHIGRETYDMDTLPEYQFATTPPPVHINAATVPREVFTECLSGVVELAFVIDREGKTQQIQVLHAEPGNTFVNPAARAIFATEYEPMIVDGRTVAARTTRTVKFAKPQECK